MAGILLDARLLLDEQWRELLSSIPGQQDMEGVWVLLVVEMVLLAEDIPFHFLHHSQSSPYTPCPYPCWPILEPCPEAPLAHHQDTPVEGL